MDAILYNICVTKIKTMLGEITGKSVESVLNGYSTEDKNKVYLVINRICNKFDLIYSIVWGIDQEFDGLIADKMMEQLILEMNLYIKNINFYDQYSTYYWKNVQDTILNMWKEYPEDESKFIKFFGDVLDYTMNHLPDVCVKKLKDFNNLYRACSHHLDKGYDYIIPNPDFAKDNRWNDDNVANLYLSYDNMNLDYKNIKLAQKTCFSELKLKEEKNLFICQFKAKRKSAKIMDLSFQKMNYTDVIETMGGLEDVDKIIKNISKQDTKAFAKLQKLSAEGKKEEFNKLLDKTEKKLYGNKKYRTIQEIMAKVVLGNLCDAIFYAVDKEDNPDLEAYIPFRKFSKYLITKGFDGIAYRSTRMQLEGIKGTCLIVFEPAFAEPVRDTGQVYYVSGDTFVLEETY